MVFTIVADLLRDHIGRCRLLLTAMAALTVALVVLEVCFSFSTIQHHAPYPDLVGLPVYIAGFAVGLGPVSWLVLAFVFFLAKVPETKGRGLEQIQSAVLDEDAQRQAA